MGTTVGGAKPRQIRTNEDKLGQTHLSGPNDLHQQAQLHDDMRVFER